MIRMTRHFATFLTLSLFSLVSLGADIPVDMERAQWDKGIHLSKTSDLLKHTLPITYLTIHYTANCKSSRLRHSLEKRMKYLYDFSLNKPDKPVKVETGRNVKWGDIPYHFFLSCENKLVEARSVDYRPSSSTNYRTNGHLTIVVEADQTTGLRGRGERLLKAIKDLQRTYNIRDEHVGVHRHHVGTSCPGPHIQKFIEDRFPMRAQ